MWNNDQEICIQTWEKAYMHILRHASVYKALLFCFKWEEQICKGSLTPNWSYKSYVPT